ncbi:DNA repair protein RadC (plasmid) [Lactobacillus sp. PV037]|uniref:JAB domain-containing protein n=1 Tax=Lactobacillus sp. PV037 TaxID=2594496 RepID=UPI0022406214|nr:JAB domain-containing protein [Lactobacillus sp. PV037]QNQ82964.1 DNA repair protein RadC [Lactobacillus sp. PV037]
MDKTEFKGNFIVLDELKNYLEDKEIKDFDALFRVMVEKKLTSKEALSEYILSSESDTTIVKILRTLIQDLKGIKLSNLTIFDSSVKVGKYIMDNFSGKDQEELKVFYLNTKNELIAEKTLSKGTVNKSLAHPRDVLRWALIYNATGFIISHNHPSGNITPSPKDIEFTKTLVKSSKDIGIACLDHFIVSDWTYLSLAEEHLM